ncbi:alpha/beta fold hydrolase [Alkalihalobacillus sp. BA299]|uniref:alpha/beta fold hydrolase n=1 Tax=Alkalihalobacillus sp. BA299 TaxID=2815938 RepID=UPI001ADD498E|nr:alpha/beta fold hydrolase [Alkalihalobacillus sp. BA299]
MGVCERFFCIHEQWSVVHLPEKPNGFAILLIGDINHFVNEKTSLWLQHPERFKFINTLRKEGYTIFTSNFFGRHWGSDKACQLAESLYYFIMKREILNHHIHIVAEGMGALLALKLFERMRENIRSAILINPCLSLYRHYKAEQNDRLFYKRLLSELSQAYDIKKAEVEEKVVIKNNDWQHHNQIPLHIYHETSYRRYRFEEHSKRYEKYRSKQNSPIKLTLYLPGKSISYFSKPIFSFFHQYEKNLTNPL